MTYQPDMMYQPERKGCWGRNWKWIVPTGCLGLIILAVALAAGVFFFVVSAVKSSDVYRRALERAKADPAVVAELGQPISDGWLVRGTVETSGRYGHAKFQIPISGPKNSGTIYAEALKVRDLYENDDWNFETLEVEVKGRPDRINLVKSKPSDVHEPEGDSDNANDDTDEGGVTGGVAGGDEPPPPPTAARTPSGSTIISGGVLNGKAVSKPDPAYPPIAKAARASGTVTVQVTVDEEGNVISAAAVSGHPLLQAAAVAAARQAKFTPTKLSGVPVKVTGLLTYNFVPE